MNPTDVALASTPGPGPWVRHARCVDAPPELFFPGRGDDLDPARAICALCPVIDDCANYAIPLSELHGIWGGLSEAERRRLRKARAQPRRNPEPEPTGPRDPAAAPRGSLLHTLTDLTANPRRWAAVGHFQAATSASATAADLRAGRRSVPPGGTWEFVGRRSETGGSDLWARFSPYPEAAGQ